ncbi:MAG: hypothetical protein QM751_14055 [Paludibacteraceae bacterium]
MEKMHERKWDMMMSQVKLTNEEISLVKPLFMEYEQAVWNIHQNRMNRFLEFKKKGIRRYRLQ